MVFEFQAPSEYHTVVKCLVCLWLVRNGLDSRVRNGYDIHNGSFIGILLRLAGVTESLSLWVF